MPAKRSLRQGSKEYAKLRRKRGREQLFACLVPLSGLACACRVLVTHESLSQSCQLCPLCLVHHVQVIAMKHMGVGESYTYGTTKAGAPSGAAHTAIAAAPGSCTSLCQLLDATTRGPPASSASRSVLLHQHCCPATG